MKQCPGFMDFALFFHSAQYAEYRYCALRLRLTALQKTAYRRSIIRDAVVGCADEGGASSANDGLRKLSPSYGPYQKIEIKV